MISTRTRTRTRRAAGLAAAAVAASVVLAACSSDPAEEQDADAPPVAPREPAAVGIAHEGTAEPVQIGVLLAVSTPSGQGQDVLEAAQGAVVGQYRAALGGGDVELVVATDDGTAQGAVAGVEQLVADGVSGIVVASTGDHLADALETASAADTAVLLPYDRPTATPDGVWVTGAGADAVEQRRVGSLADLGVESPLVVVADGQDALADDLAEAVPGAEIVAFTGDDPASLGQRLRSRVTDGRTDGIVVAASGSTQGRIVALAQQEAASVPVVLTPDALSPAFAQSLVSAGGTAAGQLTAVGLDAGDATTLGQDARAESAASFFAALRMAAGDTAVTDLLGDRAFAEVADTADVASHDAVLALLAAADTAGSTEPAAVRDALAGSTLGVEAGLSGPELDFGDAQAAPDDAVVVLRATQQDAGVRPVATGGGAGASLSWFALPGDGEGEVE